jgi:hypothetical protein
MGALVELWLAIRPIKRIREARAAKRAAQAASSAAGGTATSLSPTESVAPATVEAAPIPEAQGDDGMFSELLKSYARSALKVAGTAIATAAVTHGMFEPSSTDAIVAALETIGGGVAALLGLWWSHRTHKA